MRGIAVCQFQQGHTGLVALLLHLVGREEKPHHSSGVLADLFRPAEETLTIPLQVALVIRGHMAFHRAVLVGTAVETQVRGDPGTREEDLHRGPGKSYIHLLLDVLIRHRIIHALHADVVVILDGSHLPDCQLKRRSRKRQQKQLLFLKTGRSVALPFLEGLVVKGIQLLSNGLIQFHEGQELAVAQSSQDPSGGHANGALHKGLVLRAAGTSRENGGAVVLGHLLVGLVEYCFRPGVLEYTGLEV